LLNSIKANSFAVDRSLDRSLIFLFLFALSGAAGLIYESLWTHYLKLILGHAAYAQLLVLVIFMGGMSLGSWLVGKYTEKIKNLLMIYALVEGIIGIAALVFHYTFIEIQTLLYQIILPTFKSPMAIKIVLWVVSSQLILIQTLLLGATFPLMAGSMIRRLQKPPEESISILYFVNCFGGFIGILLSGFVLVKQFGLPGTSFFAGILNLLIAVIFFILAKKYPEVINNQELKRRSIAKSITTTLKKNDKFSMALLGISAITGFSSFFYEIGWIRMLSLVLGSSTHSFELMLSAFILGLSLGALGLYYFIHKIKEPLIFLGYLQVSMGLFALISLPIYNKLFYIMESLLLNLERTITHYYLFTFAEQGLCLLLMMPTTICAGMSLPLITHLLLKANVGEKSIGQVYAFNTLGAILGAGLALYWVMPLFGLKMVIGFGALCNIGIGFCILITILKSFRDSTFISITVLSILVSVNIVGRYRLDKLMMSSGVFRMSRDSNLKNPDTLQNSPPEILFQKDGRTASITVLKLKDKLKEIIQIRTNGKTDASYSLSDVPELDEETQVLSGVIPWKAYPKAKTVAVIGIGSGMTSHTLLTVPTIERVDTIEIEPAMVEGAKYFGTVVERVFKDKRSHIYAEDARSFFADPNRKYDLIISEPSDPWVSGVSSLFTLEFYNKIEKQLNPNGVFVQWLGVYELSKPLVASVLNALHSQFPYYKIYRASRANLIIVAQKKPFLISSNALKFPPEMLKMLERLKMDTKELDNRLVGDQEDFKVLRERNPMINSDYFPILDLNANQMRFTRGGLQELKDFPK